MGNLREANYKGELRPIRELAQNHKKAWAFNGRIAEHHDHLANVSLGQSVSIEGLERHTLAPCNASSRSSLLDPERGRSVPRRETRYLSFPER